MHKIASDGATIDNKFTEGSVALAIPATIVDAAIMNALQEELCNLVTRYGIALLTDANDTFDQVFAAIEIMHKRGGRPAPLLQVIANNTVNADVVDFPTFDTTVVQTIEFLFSIVRKTDAGVLKESGRAYLSYDVVNGWEVSRLSGFDGGGVTFSTVVTAGTISKLRYTSTNHAGATYTGNLRITDIKEIRI